MANPIISRASKDASYSANPVSVQGVVKKTAFLLGLTTFSGLAFFFFILFSGLTGGFVYATMLISIFAGMGLSFAIMFKPHLGKMLAVPYAIVEGLFIGGLTLAVTMKAPTIAPTAMVATFVTAGVMLALYRANIIRVTEKFRSIMVSAMIAISLVYLVQIGFSLFGSSLPYLFGGGAVSIAFSLLVVVIASFSLMLDFDNVERASAMGLDKDYEWVLSIGLLSTLVWMYVEFVRLLQNLQD